MDKPTILTAQTSLGEELKLATQQAFELDRQGGVKTDKQGNPKRKFDEKIYKANYTDAQGKKKSYVRDKLNQSYFDKCAYCESICKAEIEHYRPKAAVTGEPSHLGYYWLTYEWSNLLPSCRYCNTEGGKGNHFPVQGTRITTPIFLTNGNLNKAQCLVNNQTLLNEQPYLLHPEVDNPKQHLGFEKANNGIKAIATDVTSTSSNITRGSETIRICNLDRQDLRLRRLKVIRIIEDWINHIFKMGVDGTLDDKQVADILCKKLDDLKNKHLENTEEYTLLWWYIFDSSSNFKNLISTQFTPNQASILNAAFAKL
jgi:uncharacterized protein (TIGR02646 family)